MEGGLGQLVLLTKGPNRQPARHPRRQPFPPVLLPNQIALPLRHDAHLGGKTPRVTRLGRRVFAGRTLNNRIGVLQRRAYGYRDEEYLRLKILTCMLPKL